jgi:hypothetical protein
MLISGKVENLLSRLYKIDMTLSGIILNISTSAYMLVRENVNPSNAKYNLGYCYPEKKNITNRQQLNFLSRVSNNIATN